MSLFTKSNVLEISNRAAINSSTGSVDLLINRISNHESGLNTNAHQISNISGLQTALSGKQNVISGYTGIIDIVFSVDFANQTSETAKINVSNGIIISIN